MKIRFLNFILPILALAVIATACSSDKVDSKDESVATLTISLFKPKSQFKAKSRAVAPASSQENSIKSMSVLVFDKGELEIIQVIKGDKGVIPNLKTGDKKVSVIANPSEEVAEQLAKVTVYEDLANISMSLVDEINDLGAINETKGLTMVGEGEVSLVEGNKNVLEMSVSRIVAKVILGNVDFKLEDGFETDEFKVTGIAVMKARSKSSIGMPNYLLNTGKFQFMSGIDGDISTLQDDRLKADVKIGDNNTYFYVLPNDNSNQNATLMTIMGTYKGVEQYFAFAINDKVIKGKEEITGNFLQPNHEYTLNVLIKQPIGGDPEDPRKPATLEVSISVEDWVVVPQQTEEW